MPYHVATCPGYGPRYFPSSGEVEKGGPNTGVFLLPTRKPDDVFVIPGHHTVPGMVEAARAVRVVSNVGIDR